MLRRKFLSLALGAATLGVAACNGGFDTQNADKGDDGCDYTQVQVTEPLFTPAPDVTRPAAARSADPVVLPDCRLTVFKKQEVPAQRDGKLLFIGTDIKAEEKGKLRPDQIITVRFGKEDKQFKVLNEGDYIERGQLMGILDDRLARDDRDIKEAKEVAAVQDWVAAKAVRDEYKARWDTQQRLLRGGKGGLGVATSVEDERLAKVQYEKAYYEAVQKEKAIETAKLEKNQADTVLSMHEIRADISGVFKARHKNVGDAVKNLEPVLTIHGLDTLRVEGMADSQYYGTLLKKIGKKVTVEPIQADGPTRVFAGHIQEITAVAVGTSQGKPVIVSCSEDGTVRVWDPAGTREAAILRLPSTARSAACTSGAAGNLLVCGCTDGAARVWDLDRLSGTGEPTHTLKDQHRGPITCVAFSPDGAALALGGDDRQISLWDTKAGKLLYALPGAHRGQVTSLYLTPQGRMFSAGRDNTLRIWELGKTNAHLAKTYERRTGDVPRLDITQDGGRVVLDEGKRLRILTVPEGKTEGVLQNASGNFSGFALFCPKRDLLVTAGGTEGRLQLWRTPTAAQPRPCEVRQLVPADRSATPTCAAFAPDGSFLVTGGKDKQVTVWRVPTDQEVNQPVTAEVTLVEPAVESSVGPGQMRVWAVLPNPDRRFLPGSPVTMVVYPE